MGDYTDTSWLGDLSGGGGVDTSTFTDAGWDLPVDVGSFTDWSQFPDAGYVPNTGMFYDTFTGQYVTFDQAAALDPEWAQSAYGYTGGGGAGGAGGGGTGGAMSLPGGGGGGAPPGGGGSGGEGGGPGGAMATLPGAAAGGAGILSSLFGGTNANDLAKLAGAGLGLAGAGVGAAGIADLIANANKPRVTTQMSTSQAGPMTPEQGFLQNLMFTPAMQGIAENQGLMGQQYGLLGQLQGAMPQQNPALTNALSANALGMAGGGLPALTPELQARLGDIYGAQALNIDRYLEDQRSAVRDQMNQQGWEGQFGDVIRQGPGQAMYAPALREAVRQRGLLGGQQAAQEIQLAQALPTQALQIGSGLLNQGLGVSQNAQSIAGLYNTPIATRAQIPQNLYSSMQGARGTSGTTTQNAPGPTLLDAFAPTASLLGGLGGLAYGFGQPTQQQQQNPALGVGGSGGWNPTGYGNI